jgi:hypothetical protein
MTQSVPDTTREIRARQGIATSSSVPPSTSLYGAPEAVAPFVTYLCTDHAWNINGKVFYVTGGHVALAYEEEAERYIVKNGMWTLDELALLVPQRLMYGIVNPAPPPPDLDIPGRPVQKATA